MRFFFVAVIVHAALGTCACTSQRSEHEQQQIASDASVPSEHDADEPALPLPDFASELAVDSLEDHDPSPDVVDVSLTARIAKLEVLPGTRTTLWTYDGRLPGPMIRAKPGDRLIVRFDNELPEATTIHWHGLEVPARMDGAEVSQPPIMPGESFTYEFIVPHAGLYWYHPHLDSAAQVLRGLYGPLLVEDPDAPFFGHEVVLVLDDMDIASDGTLGSPDSSGAFGDYFGREGETLLVNGKVLPTLHARIGEALRFRIVNTSNSRYLELAVPSHWMFRIGGDSEALSSTQTLRSLLLTPGERADVVLIPDGRVGDVLDVWDLSYNRYGCAEDCESFPRVLMHIALDERARKTATSPIVSSEIAKLPIEGVKEEKIELGERTQAGVVQLTINGHVFDPMHMHEATLEARVGETHVYRVINATTNDHPFHLHGFRFQVLDRDGLAPEIREWKDTLNIPGKTEARLAVTFDDRPGDWMFHCHILDHAELGMMGTLRLR